MFVFDDLTYSGSITAICEIQLAENGECYSTSECYILLTDKISCAIMIGEMHLNVVSSCFGFGLQGAREDKKTNRPLWTNSKQWTTGEVCQRAS